MVMRLFLVLMLAGSPALAQTLPAEAAVDTSLSGLVAKAHPVVQGVMALLALAAFVVVVVFLFKLGEFALAFHRLRRSEAAIQTGAAMPPTCPLAQSAAAANAELASLPLPAQAPADLRDAAQFRLALNHQRIEAAAIRRLRSGTGLLASIGSLAPFVGLFGTVFGIMNSFLAIAASRTTNLAVVAPGIAEALLATAIGLAAAIPAVALYNYINRRIALYRDRLAEGRTDVLLRFSRALDDRLAGGTT